MQKVTEIVKGFQRLFKNSHGPELNTNAIQSNEGKAYVLVVDDNKENLHVIGNFIKESGYKLAFAVNATDALEILSTNNIDLILLDVVMPDMDGYQLCKIIKNNSVTKDIPVIFLTARTDKEDIVKGFQAGGVDYVTKPFHKEELLCRVKTHVELKKALETIKKQADALRESNKFIMSTLYQYSKYVGNKNDTKETHEEII